MCLHGLRRTNTRTDYSQVTTNVFRRYLLPPALPGPQVGDPLLQSVCLCECPALGLWRNQLKLGFCPKALTDCVSVLSIHTTD